VEQIPGKKKQKTWPPLFFLAGKGVKPEFIFLPHLTSSCTKRSYFRGNLDILSFLLFIAGAVDNGDKFMSSDVDTGDKCMTGVHDTGHKFVASVVDTGQKSSKTNVSVK